MNTVGLARRSIAVVVDAMAALALIWLGFALGLLDPVIFRPEPGWFWTEWWLKHWLDAPTLFTRPIVAWIAVGLAWTVGWELAAHRTPGDRVAGIEVVDIDEDTPHPGRTALRALGLLITVASLGLGWLICFVTPSRRALHDIVSGTYVVRFAD